MCDYSLHHVASRPAKVGDKLTTRDFGTGTRGFAASEDSQIAVCVLPGTELAFATPVGYGPGALIGWGRQTLNHLKGYLTDICKCAVAEGYLQHSISEGLKAPVKLARPGLSTGLAPLPVLKTKLAATTGNPGL